MLGLLLLVVGDFDHAKYLDATSNTNRIFGTNAYLPPEYYASGNYLSDTFDIWYVCGGDCFVNSF